MIKQMNFNKRGLFLLNFQKYVFWIFIFKIPYNIMILLFPKKFLLIYINISYIIFMIKRSSANLISFKAFNI